MAIHFYKNGTTRNALFEISDENYSLLEPVFDEFKSKTGIFIDPYGNTKLYPENLVLIKELLAKKLKPGFLNEFNIFLDRIIKEDLLIVAAGD